MKPATSRLVALYVVIVLVCGLVYTVCKWKKDHRVSSLRFYAPETLEIPRRDDFISQRCWEDALDRYIKRGDWATEDSNYGEMELCDSSL